MIKPKDPYGYGTNIQVGHKPQPTLNPYDDGYLPQTFGAYYKGQLGMNPNYSLPEQDFKNLKGYQTQGDFTNFYKNRGIDPFANLYLNAYEKYQPDFYKRDVEYWGE